MAEKVQADEKVQAFLDKLTATRFADLKGSWAKIHLELSEKVLNDVLDVVVANPSLHPMLGLVKAAKAMGSFKIDLEMSPPEPPKPAGQ